MKGQSLRIILSILVLSIILVSGSTILTHAQEKYVVGTTADLPHLEWVDAKGNIVGFDPDVMRMIAYLKGYEIEIRDLPFDSLIPSLQIGEIDIVAAGTTITEERGKQVDFSDPYLSDEQGVLVREDSDLTLITVFSTGQVIAAQMGTTQADYLEEGRDAGANIEVKLYETQDLQVMDLLSGRVDAAVLGLPAAIAYARNRPLRLIGVVDYGADRGFMVKKGDPLGLLPLINGGVRELKSMGVWDTLLEGYATGDLTRITKCYGEARSLLEEGDLMAYAQALKACLTAEQ